MDGFRSFDEASYRRVAPGTGGKGLGRPRASGDEALGRQLFRLPLELTELELDLLPGGAIEIRSNAPPWLEFAGNWPSV
jgi:hypothetical protein